MVYPGYAQPVYGSGCYWASQPVYDGLGRVVGYTGRPVQVCPGYVPPPAPGYAGSPPPPLLLSFRQNEAGFASTIESTRGPPPVNHASTVRRAKQAAVKHRPIQRVQMSPVR